MFENVDEQNQTKRPAKPNKLKNQKQIVPDWFYRNQRIFSSITRE